MVQKAARWTPHPERLPKRLEGERRVVRPRALHDDGAALGALPSARAQAAPIPAEHGVDEQPRDGTEELTVEAESGSELERNCQHPLPEWHNAGSAPTPCSLPVAG